MSRTTSRFPADHPISELTDDQLADPAAYDADLIPSNVVRDAAELLRPEGGPRGVFKAEVRRGLHPQAVRTIIEQERTFHKKVEGRRALEGSHHGYTVRFDASLDRYLVSGPKSEAVNTEFKSLKGRWDPIAAAWAFPASRQRRLAAVLDRIPQLRADDQAEQRRRDESHRAEMERRRQAEARQVQQAEQAARAAVEPLIGRHGVVAVSMVQRRTRDFSSTYPALQLRFPRNERANAVAKSVGLYWDGTGYSRGLGRFDVEEVKRAIATIDEIIQEDDSAARVAADQAAQERRERDARDGRIYETDRNVDRGHTMPLVIRRNGRVYRFERVISEGPEYSDGDWMVTASYLPAGEPEAENAAAISRVEALLDADLPEVVDVVAHYEPPPTFSVPDEIAVVRPYIRHVQHVLDRYDPRDVERGGLGLDDRSTVVRFSVPTRELVEAVLEVLRTHNLPVEA